MLYFFLQSYNITYFSYQVLRYANDIKIFKKLIQILRLVFKKKMLNV